MADDVMKTWQSDAGFQLLAKAFFGVDTEAEDVAEKLGLVSKHPGHPDQRVHGRDGKGRHSKDPYPKIRTNSRGKPLDGPARAKGFKRDGVLSREERSALGLGLSAAAIGGAVALNRAGSKSFSQASMYESLGNVADAPKLAATLNNKGFKQAVGSIAASTGAVGAAGYSSYQSNREWANDIGDAKTKYNKKKHETSDEDKSLLAAREAWEDARKKNKKANKKTLELAAKCYTEAVAKGFSPERAEAMAETLAKHLIGRHTQNDHGKKGKGPNGEHSRQDHWKTGRDRKGEKFKSKAEYNDAAKTGLALGTPAMFVTGGIVNPFTGYQIATGQRIFGAKQGKTSGVANALNDPAGSYLRRARGLNTGKITDKKKKPVKKSAEFVEDVTWTGEISKVNDEKKQVFGWASVSEINGKPVVDLQGDMITPDEMERAAYDYNLNSQRIGGEMHARVGKSAPKHVSTMIESMVFTPEKIAKMGLPEGSLPTAWWVGYQIHDDEVWKGVKTGKYKGFSVHGVGKRTPVAQAGE